MKRVSRILRRLRKSVADAWLTTTIAERLERAVFRRASRSPAGPPSPFHLLIAPPGEGNIGDQAMVEAFVENSALPVRVIVRRVDDFVMPAHLAERMSVVILPHLVYGRDARHDEDLASFRRLLDDGAASLSVAGADIMDGKYSVRGSVRRWRLATLAAGAGIDTRIVGFSWNGQARAGARRAMLRAEASGVTLMPRDPVSARRMLASGASTVVEVADLVFTATTIDSDILDRLGLADGDEPLVVVNVSGLVGRSINQGREYVEIVTRLTELGCRVVLLPHVSRQGGDDMTACKAVYDRLDDQSITLVDRLLTPGEVRGLTAAARLVITGRMHLAIMALSGGVPAITLATQGKVEGLMELFGTTQLCIDPTTGFGSRVVTLIDDVIGLESSTRQRIADSVASIRTLAAGNYSGLGTVAPEPLSGRS